MGFGPCEVFNFVLDRIIGFAINAIGQKLYGDTNTQEDHLYTIIQCVCGVKVNVHVCVYY